MKLVEDNLPEVREKWRNFAAEVFKEGLLSVKTKELMAIALSIAVRCEPCLKTHTTRALKAGATVEEIAEAVSVAMVMDGGPALAWSTMVGNLLEELKE